MEAVNSLSITVPMIMDACREKDMVWLSRYYQTIRKDPEWQQFVQHRTLEKIEGAELFD